MINLFPEPSSPAEEDSTQEISDSDVPEVFSVGSDDEVSADDGSDRDVFDDDGFPKIDGDEDESSSSEVEFAPPPTSKGDPSQTPPATSFTPAPFRTATRRRALKKVKQDKQKERTWSGDILMKPSIENHRNGRMQLRARTGDGRRIHVTSIVNPSPEIKAALFRVRDMIKTGDLTKEAAVKAFKS